MRPGVHRPSQIRPRPAAERQLNTQYELLTLFADGGKMIVPARHLLPHRLGVIIAKFWTLWVAGRDSAEVIRSVEEAAGEGDLDEAAAIASATRGPAAAILLAGLRRIKTASVNEGEVEQAVSTTGSIELSFLERGLVVLATIANVAPLMGFLGTVAGMILAFDSIAQAGDVDPATVAGGYQGCAPDDRRRAHDRGFPST